MSSPAPIATRNLGFVAHINAGKTTLTERVLFVAGRQRYVGDVDDGTAAMDYLAEEQRRGISISAAATQVQWGRFRVNVIDTPGHVDFGAEVERCLRVLDGLVVILDGVRGVESQTVTVWRQADRRRIPRLVFVNKLDRASADFETALASLPARLAAPAVPIVWPVRGADGELYVYDLVEQRWLDTQAPGEPPAQAGAARNALIEACADYDEQVMAAFVEDREPELATLRAALRKGVASGALVPVLGGSALGGAGVPALLTAACRYLPAPTGGSSQDPLQALIFKTEHVNGEVVCYLRLYAGSLQVGDEVGSSRGHQFGRILELWSLHGGEREPLDRAEAGDVVGARCAVDVRTGDTLFGRGHPAELESVTFPAPVLTVALEPRTSADVDLIDAAARALADDDPTLVLDRDPASGRLHAAGMGELHLEVFASRLRRRVGDRVRIGKPAVANLESVAGTGRARSECRSGGEGSAAAILELTIEPNPQGVAIEIVPESHWAAPVVAEAMAAKLRTGLLTGFPLARCRLTLVGLEGTTDDPLLYLEACDVACRKAANAADSHLLEPLTEFEVSCPASLASGVLADLRSRRADLREVLPIADRVEARGVLRLQAMLGYATDLRSRSQGLGSVVLRPAGYAPAVQAP